MAATPTAGTLVTNGAGKDRARLRDRDGKLRWCAPLGAATAVAGIPRQAHRTAVRQTVSEKQQERRQRCRGDLRSDEPTEHALCGNQDGRATRYPGDASHPNVACVALANKTVRMAWAMLRHDCEATLHDGKPVEPALAKPFNVHVRQARQSDWELTRE